MADCRAVCECSISVLRTRTDPAAGHERRGRSRAELRPLLLHTRRRRVS